MARHVVSEDTIQMNWICGSCHHINPGMEGEREALRCAQCGQEKTESDPYVMPDDIEGAAKLIGEMERKAKLGPNWTCLFCKASSRADHDRCEVCGADKEGKLPEVPAHGDNPFPGGSPFPVALSSLLTTPMPTRAPVPSAAVADIEPNEVSVVPMRRFSGISSTQIVVAVIVVAVVALLGWAFWPRKVFAVVASTHWTRTEILRERHDYTGTGWRSDARGDIFDWGVCESRQRTTVACHPHDCRCRPQTYDCRCTGGDDYRCNPRQVSEECNCTPYDCRCEVTVRANGNGSATRRRTCDTCQRCQTCERTVWRTCTHPRVCETCSRTVCDTCFDQCPVMEQWCTGYRYHQWDPVGQPAVREGNDHSPVWSGMVTNGPLQTIDRSEQFQVTFRDLGDRTRVWDKTLSSQPEYDRYFTGQRWEIQYDQMGDISPLHILPANGAH